MSEEEQPDVQKDQFVMNGIVLNDDLLFYGSASKLEELTNLASDCIETIESSDRPRTIVIKAWLFIDFCVREMLMSGLGLSKYNLESFDLRFEFLPRSFRRCLDLIEDLKREHTGLDRDPEENSITMRGEFFLFLKRKHEDFFEHFLEIEEQYYKEKHPELAGRYDVDPTDFTLPIENASGKSESKYTHLPQGFISVLHQIDKDWIKQAGQLNKARNMAAHTYDSSKVLKAFGRNGPQAIDHLRDKCIELLEDLIGVRQEKEADEANAT